MPVHGIMMGRLDSKEHCKHKGCPPYIVPVILLMAIGVIASYPLQGSPNDPEALKVTPAQEQADSDIPEIEWIIDLAEGQERAKERSLRCGYFYGREVKKN